MTSSGVFVRDGKIPAVDCFEKDTSCKIVMQALLPGCLVLWLSSLRHKLPKKISAFAESAAFDELYAQRQYRHDKDMI